MWFFHFGVILLDTCTECFAANQDKEKWALKRFRYRINQKLLHICFSSIFFFPWTRMYWMKGNKNYIPFGPRTVEIIIEFVVNYRRVKEVRKKIIERTGRKMCSRQFFIWVYELPQPINHNFSVWMKRTLWLWSRMLV